MCGVKWESIFHMFLHLKDEFRILKTWVFPTDLLCDFSIATCAQDTRHLHVLCCVLSACLSVIAPRLYFYMSMLYVVIWSVTYFSHPNPYVSRMYWLFHDLFIIHINFMISCSSSMKNLLGFCLELDATIWEGLVFLWC